MSAPAPVDVQAPSETDMNVQQTTSTSHDALKDVKKSTLIELKNGKVVLRQKPVEWASGMSYMRGVVAFGEFLESQTSPLTSIPDSHLPVIAKLVHESDKVLGTLCRQIRKALIAPSAGESTDGPSPLENILTADCVEKCVLGLAQRRNYGLDDSAAALSVWRWEVDNLDLVRDSTANKDLPSERREQRVQAKQEIKAIFDSMPPDERDALLKKKDKAEPKAKTARPKSEDNASESTSSKADAKPPKTPKPPKEPKTPSAKQVAIQAKKAGTQKSAAVMASFFKPAASKATASLPSTSSKPENEFERRFRPFAVRKNVSVAPVNRFHRPDAEVIVLDDDGDVEMAGPSTSTSAPKPFPSDPRDALPQLLSSVPTSRRIRSTRYQALPSSHRISPQKPRHSLSPSKSGAALDGPRVLKSDSRLSVRKLMQQLNEAEINGDEASTRELQRLLSDRRAIRPKLLQFHEDYRPPYYGTWTKTSAFIGPRTPFAKDLAVFDYSYDSGDDWAEEEEAGEDVASDLGSEGEEMDEDDSDDGFLVPDDEVELVEGEGQLSSRSPSPSVFRSGAAAGKRKAESAQSGMNKRRQVVGALIPFSKGPCYEETIGQCEYEPFDAFRIRLLNDTPVGVDPFSFTSTCHEDYQVFITSQKQPADASSSSSDAPLLGPTSTLTLKGAFVVPPLPSHMSIDSVASSSTAVADQPAAQKKDKPAPPAFRLPASEYPAFLRAIEGSERPKPVLIAELYEMFKDTCTAESGVLRKGAVEAKLGEIAYKEKKVWRVKNTEWTAAGLIPPTPAIVPS